jgi:hypothetical protein
VLAVVGVWLRFVDIVGVVRVAGFEGRAGALVGRTSTEDGFLPQSSVREIERGSG